MPSTFYRLGNLSMVTLIKQSGYIEAYHQVDKFQIKEALTRHPECIDDWIMESENQRVGQGWYIKQNDNGRFTVGYFSRNERFELPEYAEIEDACAEYIKKKIEILREIALK